MRYLAIPALILALAVVAVWTVRRDDPRAQPEVARHARAALDAEGLGWATISLEGGEVRLTGVAPSAEARVRAEQVLADIPGVRRVSSRATLARLAPVGSRPPSAEAGPTGCEIDALSERLGAAPLRFGHGRYDLRDQDRARLRDVAGLLRRCPHVRLEIGAFTDDRGPAEVNRRLSLDRARAVARILIQAGVPEGQLHIEAHGESRPLADNASEAGRARNRRIELAFRSG